MSTEDLLFELGTEELPAGEISGMAAALVDAVTRDLTQYSLHYSSVEQFSTPRRLAVLVRDVTVRGADQERHVVGPPLSAARDEQGQWTPAAEGFARKQGIDTSALTISGENGMERIVAHVIQTGAAAQDVIPEIIKNAVSAIPVSKRMRWGLSRDEFLRPVQWLLLLFGEEVLPYEQFGLISGRESRGHRFHHDKPVSLSRASDYSSLLRNANVIADEAERKRIITEQVTALVTTEETVALSDELLKEVTGLVEWPIALRGSFDPTFLEVPEKALISAMKNHQKYFHLHDANTGALLPAFITIANIDSKNPARVIAGNERVIRPRLADAAFFFANDKRITLASRQSRLASVVFQQQLGSLLDKSERITNLAANLAEKIGADGEVTSRAAALAKCDLVSEMVLEFPELQGSAGANYALNDGEPALVAQAIEEHYLPRFAGDGLPTSAEASALALADRLDTLVGIFGIGEPPTGSKDPFALRRASLAVIRILIGLEQSVSLHDLLDFARDQHTASLAQDSANSVLNYIFERLDNWYAERGVSGDVVRAVLASSESDLFDIDLRIHALASFSATETAQHLAAANKRVANLLAKAETDDFPEPDATKFDEEAERALHNMVLATREALNPLIAHRDYTSALNELATLRQPVDDFFNAVMVNAQDPDVRLNRLGLLNMLRGLFTQIADIALLSSGAE